MNLMFYDILSGDTYLTSQWLTENEANNERSKGFTVKLSAFCCWPL